MSIKGFGLFTKLITNDDELAAMGLRRTLGDVHRFSNRIRLVKSFRGLKLDATVLTRD